ncbi:hypothetical protein MtrunA17_Chr2g0298741 [Medicago truncatula]|uniref:Uncharacterized protein n=1 Tax=Medicago truncatula TaxID=3880 RepID=A0A396J800_MEDTR|nr:hypothetical protein MtrunA17_Chr2g0298741 [Medicago truncatula]
MFDELHWYLQNKGCQMPHLTIFETCLLLSSPSLAALAANNKKY